MFEAKLVLGVALIFALSGVGLLVAMQAPVDSPSLSDGFKLVGYSTSAGVIAACDINYSNMNAAQRAHFTPIYGVGTPIPVRFEDGSMVDCSALHAKATLKPVQPSTQPRFNYFGQTPYFLLDGRLYPREAFNGFNEIDKARATAWFPVRR